MRSMKLIEILKDVEIDSNIPDINIRIITHDSRKLKEGRDCLFVAVNGLDFDGHKFIDDAYNSGCRNFLVCSNRQDNLVHKYSDANFISVEDTQKALPIIAKNFYNNPSSKLKLVGITGTNGKTTTAFAVCSCLQKLGKKVGLIGTIEYRICDKIIPALNTTPDALFLNELMDQMVKSGVEYLVMEVSSHALSLHRVDGLNFDVTAFTNFTQDHLDYHKTMDEYLQAKLKLFDLLVRSNKDNKIAIVNRDIEGLRIKNQELRIKKQRRSYPTVSFKITSLQDSVADYYANKIGTSIFAKATTDRPIDVSKFILSTSSGNVQIKIAMAGKFNVYNFMMAFAILSELGFAKNDIARELSGIKVKGRMESVENERDIGVIIDYAHTPDGLENLLNTVREIVEPNKKIITVFGAGGDRDKTKRPLMGEIASKLSDYIVITSDNPRTENPMSIIEDIKTGIDEGRENCKVIEDRAEAIKQALLWAEKGDIIVIAGKGHEDYQIIGKKKYDFSDKKIIEENL
ncbi:UDP-N-acetylmuramoyl-L-alanyl-D-glutamate--2,6-diaminopimelate ligase [bacterium]|nr:MAG: UDP-N-acetylmuramoyl-L-alanyl-D-glutamate--2,6-diaminopimelate ligase [bacterium]